MISSCGGGHTSCGGSSHHSSCGGSHHDTSSCGGGYTSCGGSGGYVSPTPVSTATSAVPPDPDTHVHGRIRFISEKRKKVCEVCDGIVLTDAKFCHHCGNKL